MNLLCLGRDVNVCINVLLERKRSAQTFVVSSNSCSSHLENVFNIKHASSYQLILFSAIPIVDLTLRQDQARLLAQLGTFLPQENPRGWRCVDQTPVLSGTVAWSRNSSGMSAAAVALEEPPCLGKVPKENLSATLEVWVSSAALMSPSQSACQWLLGDLARWLGWVEATTAWPESLIRGLWDRQLGRRWSASWEEARKPWATPLLLDQGQRWGSCRIPWCCLF